MLTGCATRGEDPRPQGPENLGRKLQLGLAGKTTGGPSQVCRPEVPGAKHAPGKLQMRVRRRAAARNGPQTGSRATFWKRGPFHGTITTRQKFEFGRPREGVRGVGQVTHSEAEKTSAGDTAGHGLTPTKFKELLLLTGKRSDAKLQGTGKIKDTDN